MPLRKRMPLITDAKDERLTNIPDTVSVDDVACYRASLRLALSERDAARKERDIEIRKRCTEETWLRSEAERHDRMKWDAVKLGVMAEYRPCECRMCRALSSTSLCRHAAIAERVIPAIEQFRDTDRPLVDNIIEAVKKIIEEG